jgi:MFS family permease
MTGVEILAIEEVVVGTAFNWFAFWITLGILAGVGFLTGFLAASHSWGFEWNWFIPIWILFLILGILFGTLAGSLTATPMETETHYKALISDEVSMNEFLERYEIIDQEGKIYTVRERGAGNDSRAT